MYGYKLNKLINHLVGTQEILSNNKNWNFRKLKKSPMKKIMKHESIRVYRQIEIWNNEIFIERRIQ